MSTFPMQPEFCLSNFIDLNVNPTYAVTLTPTANWYQDDKPYLYDHFQGEIKNRVAKKILYSDGADDDTTRVTIKIDFGDELFFDTIKLLQTNIKAGIIEASSDDVTYTTIKTITDNTASSVHWYAGDDFPGFVTERTVLRTEDGYILTTESGEYIELETPTLGRYIQVHLDTTQLPDDEKYIGELYIGRRAMKVTSGLILDYQERILDPRSELNEDWQGIPTLTRVADSFRADLTLKDLSQVEVDFIESLITEGGIYDFFPTGGVYGAEIDTALSIDEVHWITALPRWLKNPWGQNARDVVRIFLTETKIVS